MKLTKFATLVVIGLVLTVAASGCRKKPVGLTNLPGSRTGAVPDVNNANPLGNTDGTSGTGATTSTGIPANDPNSHANWAKDPTALQAYTVHFGFDSSVVKASERANVTAVADYLKSHPENAVEIEGHCDERGTAEYNRALGERRASALREELAKLGIAPGRVDTISYGFEKPVDPGHDDSAWAKNRRGEFILLSPPK